ncbi:M4 family metallopeptidase [Saccharopolyspora erythraea]|uniref:M4 family metallopeptidase n=1 Tax=Saccharopolyspora erythraea TaxID=1836 RepID=UPI00201394D3|nr:M4 family metallopeptidase [Saccharopolyspora erythraea]
MHSPNPIQCVVPDYVLVEIAKRGDEADRDAALSTLAVSTTLRSARSQAEAARSAAGRPLVATAGLREPTMDRVIRDAKTGVDTGSPIVRKEGDDRVGDPAVDEAFDHFGMTWKFFFEVLARNSIDNAGMTLDGVVHFGRKVDNAFWDGDQMLFGDGSEKLFTRLTKSLSVAAHELGHGVIQFDGPLVYQGQSGALNEHIADAFGVMVHQWAHHETDDVGPFHRPRRRVARSARTPHRASRIRTVGAAVADHRSRRGHVPVRSDPRARRSSIKRGGVPNGGTGQYAATCRMAGATGDRRTMSSAWTRGCLDVSTGLRRVR